MASIEPHGEKLRHLRRALGWTQLELALRAGVSERTVRSAERGRPVRREFLNYLAGALGVDLQELAREPAILDDLVRWRQNAKALTENLVRLNHHEDPSPFLEMLHPKYMIEFHDRASQQLYLAGMAQDFQGTSDIRRSIDIALELASRIIERHATVHSPVIDGDVIIFRAAEVFTYRNGHRESGWTVQTYQFEDRRIMRADHYCGSLDLERALCS